MERRSLYGIVIVLLLFCSSVEAALIGPDRVSIQDLFPNGMVNQCLKMTSSGVKGWGSCGGGGGGNGGTLGSLAAADVFSSIANGTGYFTTIRINSGLIFNGTIFNGNALQLYPGANGTLLTTRNGSLQALARGADHTVLKVNGTRLAWETVSSGGGSGTVTKVSNGDIYSVVTNQTTTPSINILESAIYNGTIFNGDFAEKTTTNLTEGTNLYYTGVRVNGDIAQAFTSNGYLVRTGSGTFSGRTFSGDNGISLTNASGVSGNSVITLDTAQKFSNANTLNGLTQNQFLRSDTTDNFTSGVLITDSGTRFDVNGDISIADSDISLDAPSGTAITSSARLTLNSTVGVLQFNPANGSNMNIQLLGVSDFIVDENKLVVNNNGNVGISDFSPDALLDVNGRALVKSLDLNGNVISVGAANQGSILFSKVSNSFSLLNNGANGTVLGVTNAGNALGFITVGGGTGDVTGPSSSVINGISLFSTTTGKAIKYNGSVNLITRSQNSLFIGNGAGASANGTTLMNTALGFSALAGGTSFTGDNNVAVGHESGRLVTSGNNNTLIGLQAGEGITTGSSNTIIGRNALQTANQLNATGSNNTCIGDQACFNLQSVANGNTVLGSAIVFNSLSSSSRNVLIGYRTGDAISTGTNNVLLGYDIDAPVASATGQLSIANIIFGNGNTATGTTVSSGKVGIKDPTPSFDLDINGTTFSKSFSINGNNLSIGGANQGSLLFSKISNSFSLLNNGTNGSVLGVTNAGKGLGYISAGGSGTVTSVKVLGSNGIVANGTVTTAGTIPVQINRLTIPAPGSNSYILYNNDNLGTGGLIDANGALFFNQISRTIGVSSAGTFDVDGTARFDGTNFDVNSSNVTISDTDISLDGASTTFTQTTGAITLTPANGSNLNVNIRGLSDFVVNSSKLVVDNNGNVGIGTTTPARKLQVEGVGSFFSLNGSESTFTGGLTQAGVNVISDYSADRFTPGIFWSTSDNNPTLPKLGIYMEETGGGTYLHARAAVSYSAGLNNAANGLVLDPRGNLGLGKTRPVSVLEVNGSVAFPYLETSTNGLTLDATHYTIGVNGKTASTNLTIHLPTATGCKGRIYNIKKIDNNGSILVIVDPNGSQTIDGSTTKSTNTQWTNFMIQSTGANWILL